MTRRYEIVYIFDSTLEEQEVNTRLERFNGLLAGAEASTPVTDVSHWGKRTLAYPIKGRDTGYYVVVHFESVATALGEFERAIGLDEGVLRYLLVLNEGEAPRPPRPDSDSDRGTERGAPEPQASEAQASEAKA